MRQVTSDSNNEQTQGFETMMLTAHASMGDAQRDIDALIAQGYAWDACLTEYTRNTPAADVLEMQMELDCDCLVVSDDDSQLDMMLPGDVAVEDLETIEGLIAAGFTAEEGLRLVEMKQHIIEHVEMHEHPQMQFARWLVRHGHLSEELA